VFSVAFPTAYAVGFILSPLRGWVRSFRRASRNVFGGSCGTAFLSQGHHIADRHSLPGATPKGAFLIVFYGTPEGVP